MALLLTSVSNFVDSKSAGEDATLISHRHFEAAFGKVRPSVSDKDRYRYVSILNKNLITSLEISHYFFLFQIR